MADPLMRVRARRHWETGALKVELTLGSFMATGESLMDCLALVDRELLKRAASRDCREPLADSDDVERGMDVYR